MANHCANRDLKTDAPKKQIENSSKILKMPPGRPPHPLKTSRHDVNHERDGNA